MGGGNRQGWMKGWVERFSTIRLQVGVGREFHTLGVQGEKEAKQHRDGGRPWWSLWAFQPLIGSNLLIDTHPLPLRQPLHVLLGSYSLSNLIACSNRYFCTTPIFCLTPNPCSNPSPYRGSHPCSTLTWIHSPA